MNTNKTQKIYVVHRKNHKDEWVEVYSTLDQVEAIDKYIGIASLTEAGPSPFVRLCEKVGDRLEVVASI